MTTSALVVHKSSSERGLEPSAVDPITAEVIRHALNSAANQMKQVLIRTAFSPVVYESLDFAVALYDRRVQLLAQAPTLPFFMGALSFCIDAAVESVGGEDRLNDGDIILYNIPYGSGSHAQDAALVMPIFAQDELLGYATIKAHWRDVGGKEPYSTDTVDVFQEGTLFPGVKLFRGGVVDDDLHRLVLSNTRVPKAVAGDLSAQVAALRTGAAALVRLVERHGTEQFNAAVERMFDHGEAVIRSYFETIPDGRYVGHGTLDDNGIDPDLVRFDVVVEVDGSNVRVDYSAAPDAQDGPLNCPQASAVSASRVALCMIAGGGEAPNEGHFRPLEVVTRPGSMFHPLPPSPCFLYAWPGEHAIEVIYSALADVMPTAVPACSGGDACAITWWGIRDGSGEPWNDGAAHPVGQGANCRTDGANSLAHVSGGATRFTPAEVWESRTPLMLEKIELAQDSGGIGRYRGGVGVDFFFRVTEDCWVTFVIDGTRTRPWGLEGGGQGRANAVALRQPGQSSTPHGGKGTRLRILKDMTLELYTGGGGGYGAPADRHPESVHADIRDGYVSESAARAAYPHAFDQETT